MSNNRCSQCGKFFSEEGDFCSQECKNGNNLEGEYRDCATCGDEFYTQPSWDYDHCSRECAAKSKRKRVQLTCEICEKKFEVQKHAEDYRRTCSRSCRGKLQSKIFENKEDSKVKCNCSNCGKSVLRFPRSLRRNNDVYCSPECQRSELHENISGENHWNWKGGWDDYFGENWFSQRSKALERDDYECQVCGIGKDQLGRKPSVHHIKPQRLFESKEESNKLSNLVTLCEKHHNKVEGWGLAPANVLD